MYCLTHFELPDDIINKMDSWVDFHLTAPVINLTPLTNPLKYFLRYISIAKKDFVLKISTSEDLNLLHFLNFFFEI